jgi:arsenite-transporting ATPase
MERTRVILYAGKGGVEKTTTAVITLCRSAELGYRTLVLSTDAARFLVDPFSISPGNRPQFIAPNLWAQESSIPQALNTYWSIIQKWLINLSHVLDYYDSK